MSTDAPQSPPPPFAFAYPLPNLAARLTAKDQGPVKIVALGSSTTAGEGGILAYPYRLEALLRAQYSPQEHPHPMIDVLNRGIGGEEAPKELERLQRDVLGENPCLVIWQVGTNSVWQSPDQNPPSLAQTIAALRDGIGQLQQSRRIDIILMDPQYVPAMLSEAKIVATHAMVRAIAEAADELKVNLFRRFELMRRLHEVGDVSFDLLVDPNDGNRLHDSDWVTQLLTQALKDRIVDAVDRANKTGV